MPLNFLYGKALLFYNRDIAKFWRMKKEGRLLTVTQVAEQLGAGTSSVRLWCTQGAFPNAERIGSFWLIPETDLDGFIKRERGRPLKKKDDEPQTPAKKASKKS